MTNGNLGSAALGVALLSLSLGACALGPDGPGDDVGGTGSALTFGAREALPRAAWLAAEAGCEGRLGTSEPLRIAFAEGEPGLRVVMLDDRALCVDSASSVTEELSGHVLEGEGLSEHLEALPGTGQRTAVGFRNSFAAGDPSPQPSEPPPAPSADESTLAARPNGGDPSPQPSDRTRPTAGDPSPQPSQPIRDAVNNY